MFIRPEYLPEGALAACNGCGAVALLVYAVGWRSFRSFAPPGLNVVQHHCATCVNVNQAYGSGSDILYRPATEREVPRNGGWKHDE
jgi:hypothetical protein